MLFDATGFKQNIALLDVIAEGRRRVEESWFRLDPGQSVPLHGHCAVLGISRQNAGDSLTTLALEYIALAVFDLPDPKRIVPWNDTPGRTKEEVLAAYDTAYQLALVG